MARRAKTKVGGGPRQDTMMRAQETGTQAVAQARLSKIGQIEKGTNRAQALTQQGIAIGAKAWEAKKDRAQQQQQFETSTKLKAASMGLQEKGAGGEQQPQQPQGPQKPPGPGQPGSAQEGPITAEQAQQQEREERLRQEMEQRGRKQGSKGLEYGSQGFEPTAGSAAAAREKQSLARMDAESRRMSAQASLARAKQSYASARAKGNTAAASKAEEQMFSIMEGTRTQISDLMSGKTDPTSILQAFSDNPEAQKALAGAGGEGAESLGATAKRMLDNQLATQNISYMAATGGAALDRLEGSEVWHRYAQNEMAVISALRTQQPIDSVNNYFDELARPRMTQALQAWQGITDEPEKQRFVRKLTASIMMRTNEAERMAGILAARRSQEAELAAKDAEIAQLKAERDERRRQMATQGFMEEGQGIPKTTEELPSGQQVESGMDFRRQQYQPPGPEPESFTRGSRRRRFKPHQKYGSGVK